MRPLKKSASQCFVILLLLCQFIGIRGMAQEEFVPPPAVHLTFIPFKMLTGGIIIIRARLDSFPDTLNFVLDTGSGGISLDSTTCSYLKLKTRMTDRIIRGIAGMKTVAFTYDHTLHFPGLDVPKMDFHINDYYILTSVYGIRIDGIIGYSFLRRFIVSIDYDKLRMEVLSAGSFKYPRGGTLLHPVFTTLPQQMAEVRDGTSVSDRFYFDTGAGLCLLLTEEMVKDSSLLKYNRKSFPTQAEGLGGKENMRLTVIKQLQIGPYRFRKIPTYIFKDEYNITAYPELGGLIGNDIFRRFNVILNYAEQEIYLKPNTHFNDPFDYTYTGLGIYLENGDITVEDIMENSPAAKAGFQEGDIILAIDNDISRDIQAFKTLLQTPDARLKVLVWRKGDLKTIYIRIGRIY